MGALDRVLVKDRIESKPRQGDEGDSIKKSWIVSLSKIALRANHDNAISRLAESSLDRVLVKDRIESKPRLKQLHIALDRCWIVSLSKIALRANHDLPTPATSKVSVGSCPCQRSH